MKYRIQIGTVEEELLHAESYGYSNIQVNNLINEDITADEAIEILSFAYQITLRKRRK